MQFRKIEFPPPNEDARLDILKIHSRKMNLTRWDLLLLTNTNKKKNVFRGINLRKIAEQMGGSSGAEVKGTCTEAGQSWVWVSVKMYIFLSTNIWDLNVVVLWLWWRTFAGMYALRERRVHVTQEDFEMAVAKIMQKDTEKNMSIKKLFK